MLVRMKGKTATAADFLPGDVVHVLIDSGRRYFAAEVVAVVGRELGPTGRVQVKRLAPGRGEVHGQLSVRRARNLYLKERGGKHVECEWA